MVARIRAQDRVTYYAPCDPTCPDVIAFLHSLLDDPMTHAIGAPVDDIVDDWEARHLRKCARCQEFGTSNIDVE
jgi:hypothetical protein